MGVLPKTWNFCLRFKKEQSHLNQNVIIHWWYTLGCDCSALSANGQIYDL